MKRALGRARVPKSFARVPVRAVSTIVPMQPFSLPTVVPLSNNRRLYFTDPRLAGFYYQIQQCLRQYGGKTQHEAKDLVENSGLFNRVLSLEGVDTLCHEPPYYWAMLLLHGKEEEWQNKYWPPPPDEMCEVSIYIVEGVLACFNFSLVPTICVILVSQNIAKIFAGYYEDKPVVTADSTLFHGCSTASAVAIKATGISLLKGRFDLDFNPVGCRGFYLSKFIAQAREWAMHYPCTLAEAAIVTYEVPVEELNKFNILRFSSYEYDKWAKFIYECRKGRGDHKYDAVEGPALRNPGAYLRDPERFPAIPRGNQFAIFSPELARVFDNRIINVNEY